MSFFLDRSLKNAMQPKKKSLTYLKNIYSHLGFSAVKIVFFASSLRFLVGKGGEPLSDAAVSNLTADQNDLGSF